MAAEVPPTRIAPGRISWRRAAKERRRSQSGNSPGGMETPEMVALSTGIGDARSADLPDFQEKGGVGLRRIAEMRPIGPGAAFDDVVDRGEG